MTSHSEKHSKTKAYWENRAMAKGTSPQSTTNDYYMRQIEIRSLADRLAMLCEKKKNLQVADIGCGNGYSTINMTKKFSHVHFHGFEYSKNMIHFAKESRTREKTENTDFFVLDLTREQIPGVYDVIYTDRCLINLPSWDSQQEAIKNIHKAIREDGIYLMIENFTDGQNNFNELRKRFGLKEISIRDHNLFFNKATLEPFLKELFESVRFLNISSQYYIGSRIIYSKICAAENLEPDYFDTHHEISSRLPFSGNFGPIGMYTLTKKTSHD